MENIELESLSKAVEGETEETPESKFIKDLLEESKEALIYRVVGYEERMEEKDKKIEKLEGEVKIDARTGMYKMEFCQDVIKFGKLWPHRENRLQNVQRGGDLYPQEPEKIAVIFFDIDRFKLINDDPKYGYDVGNMVLANVSKIIRDNLREGDMGVRYGGEELLAVMIGSTLDGAEAKAELIRNEISELQFEGYPDLHVTISAGVAISDDFESFEDEVSAAGKAVHLAKDRGRNTVEVYSPHG